MNVKKILILICVLHGFTSKVFAQKNTIQLLNTFHIASAGGWDYVAVQPNSNKLFLSHGTQVNILDKTTGDSLGVIPNTTGVHGIAFVPSLNKGFTSNGKLNDITVFNLSSNAVMSKIAVGANPDAIFYETFSKTIITCNGKSKDLSFVNPETEKVIATVALNAKPETAVSNNKGLIYVNLEDKHEIAVVDVVNFTLLKTISLAPGIAPTGLAYDTKTERLFAGCSDNEMLIIVNAVNGNIVDSIAIGAGCDGVAFDPELKNIYTSNGTGTLSVIKEVNADKFEKIADITTKRGARTICVDEVTHKIYLPTADFAPADKPEERPKILPGSFQVLVYLSVL
jgi:WD40 repeat protein